MPWVEVDLLISLIGGGIGIWNWEFGIWNLQLGIWNWLGLNT